MIDKRLYPYAPKVWPTLKPGAKVVVQLKASMQTLRHAVVEEATKDSITVVETRGIRVYSYEQIAAILWPPEATAEKI